jgi:hypothetical protein
MNATNAIANTIANATETAITSNVSRKNKVKMSLLKVSEYRMEQTHCDETECAICYKRINNKVFICPEPCGKTFHPTCMEKMIDQIEENAWQESGDDDEKDPEYRCCYCRREFDIQNHDIEIFMRHLMGLKAGGYDVNEAIIQAHNNVNDLENGDGYDDDDDESFEYNIYIPLDKTFVKKPKQAKRSLFKQPKKRNHNMRRSQFHANIR